MTTDSKDPIKAIKEKKADLTLCWKASTFWPENRETTETLPLNEEISAKHPLILGRLIFSEHPDIAKKFMQLAISPEGQTIFKHHGFHD